MRRHWFPKRYADIVARLRVSAGFVMVAAFLWLSRPDAISLLYRETLARDLPASAIPTLGKRAVAFHDEWFEDPGFVLQILKRVLELDPRAEWAFERLSLLLTMAERWEDLLSAYDVAIAQCDDRENDVGP